MGFNFCSIASGSSGNCYLVATETTALLVDAGISGKKIMEGLTRCGVAPEDISAVLVTHEHSDHVRSLRVLGKKLPNLMVYSNISTGQSIADMIDENRHMVFASGDDFDIGDIHVRSFRTHHDSAESVSYSFTHDGGQISILTDTGYVCDDIYKEIKDADILALEANHDPNVLAMCRYPYYVKRRILSDEGHLSNEAAAECIARLTMEDRKRRCVLLAHLSKENNSPEMAMITVNNRLQEDGIYIGDELQLGVLLRDEMSPIYSI